MKDYHPDRKQRRSAAEIAYRKMAVVVVRKNLHSIVATAFIKVGTIISRRIFLP
jgi:hypothetical protein